MVSVGATAAVNWNSGNIQTFTLTGSTTLTFSNPQNGATYILVARQASSVGSYTITWPTISWSGAVTPVMTATINKYDIYTLIYVNSQYYGSYVQNFT